MSTVLFILRNYVDGKEQAKIYFVPLKEYVPIALFPYLDEGQSVPISGHFDGEELRGIFRITVAYPGSGRTILPELGNKKTLGELDDTVNGYRACIVYEAELEGKVPLDAIPVMHPRPVLGMLST